MGNALAVPMNKVPELLEDEVTWVEFFYHPKDDLIWSRRSNETSWTLLDEDEALLMAPQLSQTVTRFHFGGLDQAEVSDA